jgi:putative membrane protein
MNPPPDRRPAWQREGREPDYRFSLANERTFLAWIRTALALLAGAVLFDQLAVRPPGHPYVSVLAVLGSGIAALLAAVAYWRWRGNEIAMRHDRPLPGSKSLAVLAVLLFASAALVTLMLAGAV